VHRGRHEYILEYIRFPHNLRLSEDCRTWLTRCTTGGGESERMRSQMKTLRFDGPFWAALIVGLLAVSTVSLFGLAVTY